MDKWKIKVSNNITTNFLSGYNLHEVNSFSVGGLEDDKETVFPETQIEICMFSTYVVEIKDERNSNNEENRLNGVLRECKEVIDFFVENLIESFERPGNKVDCGIVYEKLYGEELLCAFACSKNSNLNLKDVKEILVEILEEHGIIVNNADYEFGGKVEYDKGRFEYDYERINVETTTVPSFKIYLTPQIYASILEDVLCGNMEDVCELGKCEIKFPRRDGIILPVLYFDRLERFEY